jgi:amino acid adenylation domain-containing protein/non-ribosomal peptide synthase protein (TIGR01720 family)
MDSPDDKTTSISAARQALLERRLSGVAASRFTIPRRGAGEPNPSPVQHGMWVHNQFLERKSVYNIPRIVWLHGPLSVTALREAFSQLIVRHEALRTTFTGDARLRIVIHPFLEPSFEVVDLSRSPERVSKDSRPEAIRLAAAELERPFDLEHGPLIRAVVVRVGVNEHLLILMMHHIISDGWSCGVMISELSTLYRAAVEGKDPMLPALPVQYTDYAEWQSKRVSSQLLADQLAYWREALKDSADVLTIPCDRTRPTAPSHLAGKVTRSLPPRLSAAMRQVAATYQITLYTVLLTGFEIVLARQSAQERFVIGTVALGRSWAELERLIGLFVNTMSIPVDVSGDPSFRELLQRTNAAVLGALDHQDVTFEQVISELQIPRESSRNPLFQAHFQLDEAGAEWDLPGIRAERAPLEEGMLVVDLQLMAVARPESIGLELAYTRDLFDPATADSLLGQVENVLEQMAANPSLRARAARLLSCAEEDLVLHRWNDTATAFPAESTVHNLFEEQVRQVPDATAIVAADGSEVSYAQLNARANQLARFLRSLGVKPESIVGLCVDHSVELFIGMLAILKAGGAYVPLDPEHPADRLDLILTDTDARVLISVERLRSALPSGFAGRVVCVDSDSGLFDDYSHADPAPAADAENLVYAVYTSGSTGQPKGVLISHRALVNYLCWAAGAYGLAGASGAPLLGSLAFDLPVTNFMLPLAHGKSVTLLPAGEPLQAVADLLAQPHDFSLLKITPGHLDALQGLLSARSVNSVRVLAVGGDKVRAEAVAGWRRIAPRARFMVTYGPTETTVSSSTYEIPEDLDLSRTVPIGRPAANTQMYVLDGLLQPVPVGVVGELFIGGQGVARGYLGRPALTAGRFVPDPFGVLSGGRLYRTGDLARFRRDGIIEFVDRADNQVKIRGYRIEPGEIEARVLLHPAVAQAVVVAREDSHGRKQLVAYLVSATTAAGVGAGADAEPPSGELEQFLKRTLPEYMVPTAFVFLNAMPLSQSGKVDRAGLAAGGPRPGGGELVVPRSSTELALAGVWSEVLQVEQVGVHDNFFSLGGDSILAIHIMARARQAGLSVTPQQILTHQTIAELAAVVDEAGAGGVAAGQADEDEDGRNGEVPLSPIERWFTEMDVPHDHFNQSVRLEWHQRGDPALIADALAAVVGHHDALRLRLSRGAEGWRQHVADRENADLLRVVDLTAAPVGQREQIMADAATQANTSLSLADGPIVTAVLFQAGDQARDQLVVIIHHLAVDTVSWQVFLEDLVTAYRQRASGDPVVLPAKTTSFQHWARRLVRYAQLPEMAAESVYWQSVRPAVHPLPVDHASGANTQESARTVTAALPAAATRALLYDVPAAYRTQIGDILLTALVRALAPWAEGDSILIDLESHGREPLFTDVDLSRTIGWFTAVYPISLPLPAGGGDAAQIKTIKEHLRAVPHHGIGYGISRYLRGTHASTRWPGAQIVFNYHGQHATAPAATSAVYTRGASTGTERAPAGPRPYLIEIDTSIIDGEFRAAWTYSAHHHARHTITHLATSFHTHLQTLITHCTSGTSGATPSDFPSAGLDQAALDLLLGRLDA